MCVYSNKIQKATDTNGERYETVLLYVCFFFFFGESSNYIRVYIWTPAEQCRTRKPSPPMSILYYVAVLFFFFLHTATPDRINNRDRNRR